MSNVSTKFEFLFDEAKMGLSRHRKSFHRTRFSLKFNFRFFRSKFFLFLFFLHQNKNILPYEYTRRRDKIIYLESFIAVGDIRPINAFKVVTDALMTPFQLFNKMQ